MQRLNHKYKCLEMALQYNQQNLEDTIEYLEEKSYFYFKELTKLSVDILYEQNQISKLEEKCKFMEDRKKELERKQNERKKLEEQEKKRAANLRAALKNQKQCPEANCSYACSKDSDLHFHKIVWHSNDLMHENRFSFKENDPENDIQISKIDDEKNEEKHEVPINGEADN